MLGTRPGRHLWSPDGSSRALASPGASSLDTSLGALVRGQPLRWLVAAAVVAGAAAAAIAIADGALLVNGFGEVVRRPELLLLLLGGYAAAFVLRAVAWKGLLGRAGSGVAGGRLLAILHAALFANHALPRGRQGRCSVPISERAPALMRRTQPSPPPWLACSTSRPCSPSPPPSSP